MIYALLGIVLGVLGFLPLFISLKISKKITRTSNLGYGGLFISSIVVSLLIMVFGVVLVMNFAREEIIVFVMSTGITLSLIAIIYGFYTVVKRNKTAEKRLNKDK